MIYVGRYSFTRLAQAIESVSLMARATAICGKEALAHTPSHRQERTREKKIVCIEAKLLFTCKFGLNFVNWYWH